MHPIEMPLDPSGQTRVSIYQKLIPGTLNKLPSLHHKPSLINASDNPSESGSQTPLARTYDVQTSFAGQPTFQASTSHSVPLTAPVGPQIGRRISYANPPVIQTQGGLTPLLESVDHAIKDTGMQSLRLGGDISPDDFTRAVAVATASALRHQQNHAHSPARARASTEVEAIAGGHEAPSWSRTTSASVLLACTALYAAIAGAKYNSQRLSVVRHLNFFLQRSSSRSLMSCSRDQALMRNSSVSLFSHLFLTLQNS